MRECRNGSIQAKVQSLQCKEILYIYHWVRKIYGSAKMLNEEGKRHELLMIIEQ